MKFGAPLAAAAAASGLLALSVSAGAGPFGLAASKCSATGPKIMCMVPGPVHPKLGQAPKVTGPVAPVGLPKVTLPLRDGQRQAVTPVSPDLKAHLQALRSELNGTAR